jgi:hypothetical protein
MHLSKSFKKLSIFLLPRRLNASLLQEPLWIELDETEKKVYGVDDLKVPLTPLA